MELRQVAKALSNPTRINLLKIISENPRTAAETHRVYLEEYEDKRRESIYRELELLVDANLIAKQYDGDDKGIKYHTLYENLIINIPAGRVEPEDGH